ncbi:LpxI family protein [Amaricoccus tamworthensis]|uniref:LpxI family protein n=1 Tax=Amaricoccus tamworthensis TaxID=57002 RepID=UPI003C7E88FB
MAAADGLAIVAGRGELPRLLAEKEAARGGSYRIVQFEGVELDWSDGHPVIHALFEKPGRLFARLREAGCRRVVFAGGMVRPELKPFRFDLKMLKLAPMVMSTLRSGDSTTLQTVVRIFEAEGMTVVAAHDLLPDLLVHEGSAGRVHPGENDLKDMERARGIVDAMGVADVGQATVVARGICLGVESIQGTDAMLKFVADTRTDNSDGTRVGVLYKAPKPGQDWRMDLPVIGRATVENAARAGLAGIAVQAGGVMMLGREETVSTADRHGVFVYGLGGR